MLITKLKSKLVFSALLLTSITSVSYPSLVKAENVDLSEMVASEDFLVLTADMMNKSLPLMLDQDTRWDSSSAGPGKTLNYNYTLVNYSASQIDKTKFTKNNHQLLTQMICDEPATQIFPQGGVLLNFNYYDNINKLIANVKLEPSDCGY
ncbi:MAG: hypothetical protein ACRC06_02770 [Waterburya sp.]